MVSLPRRLLCCVHRKLRPVEAALFLDLCARTVGTGLRWASLTRRQQSEIGLCTVRMATMATSRLLSLGLLERRGTNKRPTWRVRLLNLSSIPDRARKQRDLRRLR